MNLEQSEMFVPDYIPVVVLNNCESRFSYIQAELFNMCLKEFCFPHCWKVSMVVPVFENIGDRSTSKKYYPVSRLLSVVSNVFEKIVNNRYGFRYSRSTTDFLTVVYDIISKVFTRYQATRAAALGISKTFDRIWHAGLFHKFKSYRFIGQIFGVISCFLNNWLIRVVLDGKFPLECPVNTRVSSRLYSQPYIFHTYSNDIPDYVICNIAIYTYDNALYSKCDKVSDLSQQLELASELESDLRDTMDWDRK